jgi:PAS domain S-box-containing protein
MRDKSSASSGGEEKARPSSENPAETVPAIPLKSEFRWQAFFQRAREPLFLLNRQRRILFVNRAWEELTGVPAAGARGEACTRRQITDSNLAWSRALCPPREVLEGRNAAIRRVIPQPGGGRTYWDIEFFPLQDVDGLLLVLGKIKPLAEAETAIVSALPEKLVARRRQLADRYRFEQLDGESPALRRALEQVRLASQTLAPVLIVGEPGSGKRHISRIIHHQGIQGLKGYSALECAGLPEATLQAALFGEGGLLSRPDLGTLYLAEPGRLPRDMQARLAHVLTEETTGNHSRARIIAGCCHSPEEETKAGLLAENLLAALGTLVIHLPPLRDRSAELGDLTNRILDQLRAGEESTAVKVTPAATEILQTYSWPGNWRELRQVLAAALEHCQGDRIDATDLPAYVRLAVSMDPTPAADSERQLPLDGLLEQAERRLILHALKLAGGNKTRAAEILAIWRPRLLRRMEALGIKDTEG